MNSNWGCQASTIWNFYRRRGRRYTSNPKTIKAKSYDAADELKAFAMDVLGLNKKALAFA